MSIPQYLILIMSVLFEACSKPLIFIFVTLCVPKLFLMIELDVLLIFTTNKLIQYSREL